MAHAKTAEGEHRGRSPTAHEPGDRQKQKINLRVMEIIRINPPHIRRRVREHDEPPERAPGPADVSMPKFYRKAHALIVPRAGRVPPPLRDSDLAQGSSQANTRPTNWRAISSARFGRRLTLRYPRAGAKRSAHRQTCRRRSPQPKRSAPTKLPTRLASSGAVGTNKVAKRNLPDRAWRFGPTATLSGRAIGFSILDLRFWILDFGFCGTKAPAPVASVPTTLPTLVGRVPARGCGAVGPNKHRQAGSARPSLASDQQQLSVGGAITHFRSRLLRDGNRHPLSGSRIRRHRWFQANESPTPVASTETVGARNFEIRSGKNFRDRCVGRVG